MPRPPAEESKDTVDRLLVAAAEAFARDGHQARLGDIAAAIGIRRSSLLYHFPTKEHLHAAVVRGAFAGLGAALAGAMTLTRGVDFRRRFDDVLSAFTEFVERHRAVARVVLRELVGDGGPGREILVEQVVPLLDVVERFIRIEGRGIVRVGLPIRAALLQIASDVVLRAAAGALGPALWGPRAGSRAAADALFFAEPQESSQ
ncbi:MAG: TetR/AcrR family transcriptional regulator [Nannocystaceae bacterium]